jgi:hypothetical protein
MGIGKRLVLRGYRRLWGPISFPSTWPLFCHRLRHLSLIDHNTFIDLQLVGFYFRFVRVRYR